MYRTQRYSTVVSGTVRLSVSKPVRYAPDLWERDVILGMKLHQVAIFYMSIINAVHSNRSS